MNDILHYGPHQLQTIKVFKRVNTTKETIVFIHGGGWRDPVNTYDDFKPLMSKFHMPINLLSINYRLSPKVNNPEELPEAQRYDHPLHLIDVLCALSYIQGMGLKITLVVGHSVGSTLCLQLLNYDRVLDYGFKFTLISSEVKTILETLDLSHINFKSIFLLDGIYDIQELIQEYGDEYKTFVKCAFKNDRHFIEASALSNNKIGLPEKFINSQTCIYIIHSLQDELVSLKQSQLLDTFLKAHNILHKFLTGDWGLHEEIYTRKEIAQIIIENQLSDHTTVNSE